MKYTWVFLFLALFRRLHLRFFVVVVIFAYYKLWIHFYPCFQSRFRWKTDKQIFQNFWPLIWCQLLSHLPCLGYTSSCLPELLPTEDKWYSEKLFTSLNHRCSLQDNPGITYLSWMFTLNYACVVAWNHMVAPLGRLKYPRSKVLCAWPDMNKFVEF